MLSCFYFMICIGSLYFVFTWLTFYTSVLPVMSGSSKEEMKFLHPSVFGPGTQASLRSILFSCGSYRPQVKSQKFGMELLSWSYVLKFRTVKNRKWQDSTLCSPSRVEDSLEHWPASVPLAELLFLCCVVFIALHLFSELSEVTSKALSTSEISVCLCLCVSASILV